MKKNITLQEDNALQKGNTMKKYKALLEHNTFEEYNTKVVTYPDGSVEIIKYGTPKIRGSPMPDGTCSKKIDTSKKAMERRAKEQAYRIKRKLKYYTRSNDFDKFWTLTFNDEKVNALNYEHCRKRLRAWLKYQREKYGKFGYIFLPELHPKSERIHFHGVTEGFEPPLTEARNPKTNRLIKKKGTQIYNAENWQDGFSTVSNIEDKAKTASYISKYVTKELVEMPSAYNQPRYFCSRDLKQPTISYENWDNERLQDFTPSFVVGSQSGITMNFESDVSIYNLNMSEGQLSQSISPETMYKAK
jgi:hypothetical protein